MAAAARVPVQAGSSPQEFGRQEMETGGEGDGVPNH